MFTYYILGKLRLMLQSFQELTQEKKVDFFVKCQELMIKHHPDSPFVVREKDLEKVLTACEKNILKYQGYSYSDDNVCVLWNHIVVTDPKDVKRAVQENAYRPPNPDFNAVSIDFAVFKHIKDCVEFIRGNDNDRIEHILFIRDGVPKLYPKSMLVKGIGV